jgi:hypothetical protein
MGLPLQKHCSVGAIPPVNAASPSARVARQVLSYEQEGAVFSGKKVHVQDQEGAFWDQEATFMVALTSRFISRTSAGDLFNDTV